MILYKGTLGIVVVGNIIVGGFTGGVRKTPTHLPVTRETPKDPVR